MSSNDTTGIAESLAEIKAGVRLTSSLLDGLLEYARLESEADVLHEAEFLLDDLVQDCLKLHAGLAGKKQLLWPTAPRTGITLRTDRLKLQRVLNNLLDNAIKFTDRGGVRFNIERSATGVDLHVIDTGRGITAENQGKLFDEFFQVENFERDRQKGFGLGLCIARRLCRQLGGELRVVSEVGHGTRFTVVLAAVVPPAGRSPAIETVDGHNEAFAQRPRVLVVEDDAVSLSAMSSILRRKGFDVVAVSLLKDGLAALTPPPAFVLLDLMLPDGNGLDLLAEIRRTHLQTRVLVITAVNDPARLRAVHQLKPDLMLQKPIDLARLMAELTPTN